MLVVGMIVHGCKYSCLCVPLDEERRKERGMEEESAAGLFKLQCHRSRLRLCRFPSHV